MPGRCTEMPDSLPGYVGRPVPRREDERLLLGGGAFVADMRLPRMLHVAFARSSLPHARIASIDLGAARSAEGVAFAASGPDLGLPPIDGMQVTTPQGWRDRVETDIVIPDQPLLPADKVRYVGEAYALIVAEDRYLAEDALELIDAALEPLPSAPDPEAALRDGAPLVHENLGRNVAARLRAGKGDATSAAPRPVSSCAMSANAMLARSISPFATTVATISRRNRWRESVCPNRSTAAAGK